MPGPGRRSESFNPASWSVRPELVKRGSEMPGFFDFFLSAFRRSLLTVILSAAVLNLALFSSCSAIQAVSASGAVQKTKSAQAKPTSSLAASVQGAAANRQVVNIVVDRIDGDTVYARDGRKFEIGASTKVIDNSRKHQATRTRTAELFFANGSLESVSLK